MAGQELNAQELLELQKKNCIFCKIISKEIPSTEIYSDDKVVVILDINPANEGHCLILPREHYQILPQIPPELIKYLGVIVKRVSRCLLKALTAEGTSVFIANGVMAGQKAPHFMIHVIPRRQGDMLFSLPKLKADENKIKEMRAALVSMMNTSPKKEAAKKLEKKPEKPEEVQTKKKDKEIDVDKIAGLFT